MKRSITILHIKKKNLLWDQCDNLSKVSKQLYNVGLYILRQGLVKEERWISDKELYDTMKLNENWVLLPRKVSNQVWRQVNSSWSSWLKALKAFAKSPQGFLGRPKMPKYQSDRNIVAYELKLRMYFEGLLHRAFNHRFSLPFFSLNVTPYTLWAWDFQFCHIFMTKNSGKNNA